MSSERKRRAEIIRLIVATRERFPHTPRLTSALRRVMWRYATMPPKRRKHKPKNTRLEGGRT